MLPGSKQATYGRCIAKKDLKPLAFKICLVLLSNGSFFSPVYQDESSDELSEALDDLLLPASDTEDIWQQNGDDVDDDDESDEEEDDDDDDDDEEQVEQVRRLTSKHLFIVLAPQEKS